MIPGFGEVADGLNALIYLGRDDYLNASLSAGAMIPFAGYAATGVKFTNKGKNATGKGKKVIEGIYDFRASSGKIYVGQSKDIERRLAEHIKSGKLPTGTQVNFMEVLGGKTSREVAEQKKNQLLRWNW